MFAARCAVALVGWQTRSARAARYKSMVPFCYKRAMFYQHMATHVMSPRAARYPHVAAAAREKFCTRIVTIHDVCPTLRVNRFCLRCYCGAAR